MFYLNFLIIIILLFKKLFLSISFLFISYYQLKFLEEEKFHSKFFKFEKKIEIFQSFFLISSFFFIFFYLFFKRLINVGNKFDIFEKYVDLKIYIQKLTNFQLFVEIFYLLSLFILFITLILTLKNILFKHFFKLHLFFLNLEDLFLVNKYYASNTSIATISYYNFIHRYHIFINNYIKKFFYYLFKPIIFIFFRKDKNLYKIKLRRLEYLSWLICGDYYFYLIFFVFFYDLLKNDFFLTKIFYLLPITFIYYLLISFDKFLCNIMITEQDIVLCCFYYKPIKTIEEKYDDIYITFQNNLSFSGSSIKDTIEFVMNNFKLDIEYKEV